MGLPPSSAGASQTRVAESVLALFTTRSRGGPGLSAIAEKFERIEAFVDEMIENASYIGKNSTSDILIVRHPTSQVR